MIDNRIAGNNFVSLVKFFVGWDLIVIFFGSKVLDKMNGNLKKEKQITGNKKNKFSESSEN